MPKKKASIHNKRTLFSAILKTKVPAIQKQTRLISLTFCSAVISAYMSNGNVFLRFDHSTLLVEFLGNSAPDTSVEIRVTVIHFKVKGIIENWVLQTENQNET